MGAQFMSNPSSPFTSVLLLQTLNTRTTTAAAALNPFGFRSKVHSKRLPPLKISCRSNEGTNGGEEESSISHEWIASQSASPYQILGVDPTTSSCSPALLKAAFRARVKEFHPDVCKEMIDADAIIQRVIQAYEVLSKRHAETTEGACLDPFEEPECEAYDLFVNEVLCVGKGCPYSCVQRAPYAFSFTSENGTARAISQGYSDDYQVQLAVGQCPRRCIHYVTPSQRAVLVDVLDSVLNNPFDMGEAAFLESLITQSTFVNNRYRKEPKRQPKVSTEYVDWS